MRIYCKKNAKLLLTIVLFVFYFSSFSIHSLEKNKKIYKMVGGYWQKGSNVIADQLSDRFRFRKDGSFDYFFYWDHLFANVDSISGKYLIKNDSIFFRIEYIAEKSIDNVINTGDLDIMCDWSVWG